MTELDLYRRDIAKSGGTTVAVDVLVEDAVAVLTRDALEPLLQRLETEARKLDWLRDSDYAAVALQFAAPRAPNVELRRRLLSFALERARWCASCATAGGEGIARSLHIRELEALLYETEFRPINATRPTID